MAKHKSTEPVSILNLSREFEAKHVAKEYAETNNGIRYIKRGKHFRMPHFDDSMVDLLRIKLTD